MDGENLSYRNARTKIIVHGAGVSQGVLIISVLVYSPSTGLLIHHIIYIQVKVTRSSS